MAKVLCMTSRLKSDEFNFKDGLISVRSCKCVTSSVQKMLIISFYNVRGHQVFAVGCLVY